MQHKPIILLIFVVLLFSQELFGQGNTLSLPLSELGAEKLHYLEVGKIASSSHVSDFSESDIKKQKLDFYIAGLHKRNCTIALRKLSQYEKYQTFLGMVEKSEYHTKTNRINFLLASPLLPVKMSLNFKIPRIRTIGSYPFEFDRGFLKNLTGTIHVEQYKDRCLFYTKAKWNGPHSGYPAGLFEFFSNTLAKLAMEKLLQVSRI